MFPCYYIYVFFLLVEMSYVAYYLMKKSVKQLGPKVLDIIAEPLKAYISNVFRMFHNEQQELLWDWDYPVSLHVTYVFNLQAGNAQQILLFFLFFKSYKLIGTLNIIALMNLLKRLSINEQIKRWNLKEKQSALFKHTWQKFLNWIELV